MFKVDIYQDQVYCQNCGELLIHDIQQISDGYHTIDELYKHRIALFIALMSCNTKISWWSRLHYDGTMFEGYVIAGIQLPTGMITYHFKNMYIEYLKVAGIKELENAPEWDGHTSQDVVKRLLDAVKPHY